MNPAWAKRGAAMAALLALGYFLYPYVEVGRIWSGVTGIDVSHHQGVIDWPRVKSAGVAFAYIKATEGGDFVDPDFRKNWDAAQAAGVPRGAYHFFRQCKTGAEQAKNFIATVPLDADALPPVVDAEHMGPCPAGTPVADQAKEIKAFLNAAAGHFGCRPIIYTTPEFERVYLQAMNNETYWVRSIMWPPFFKTDRWVFWQYHNDGRRDGVTGGVDLNVFRGTAQDFAKFRSKSICAGGATATP